MADTPAPATAKRISEVPTDRLAHNFVGSLIEAKGRVELWDAMSVKLISMLREEFAAELAAERARVVKLEAAFGAFIAAVDDVATSINTSSLDDAIGQARTALAAGLNPGPDAL